MPARHLVLLVEEPSMEAFLVAFLPRIVSAQCSYEVHAFQGKGDLLTKLNDRLRGYSHWLPAGWRIVVVVDRDDDDCVELRRRLDAAAANAGLRVRRQAGRDWQVASRIAIEELEAWYFGDWEAVREVFPRVSSTVRARRGMRNPDRIAGGTWETFERVLQQFGYCRAGLPKIDTARRLGAVLEPSRCESASFERFHALLLEAMA